MIHTNRAYVEIKRRSPAGAVVVAAVIGVLTPMLGACGSPDTTTPAAAEPPALTRTTAPSPAPVSDDGYLDALAGSGQFPADVATGARDLWLQTGRMACDLLESTNGDIIATRRGVGESLIKNSDESWATQNLTERSETIVEAAKRHLCPEWSAP
ncbi:hypothetical protein B0I33_106175 [Prauserella shujinwangii]|uniref:DUF732 domain-containing protein n=1 Tax=Prauserella shujinwangii TaxID=1453103 RepID=A0A2T0LTL2_9PSEU|nr:DUF732 domain-containing protein [Prauserella shujinwangii]PRX47077.1 hypothetical protein B0I33_106175 [Prauserella shujinwangii]